MTNLVIPPDYCGVKIPFSVVVGAQQALNLGAELVGPLLLSTNSKAQEDVLIRAGLFKLDKTLWTWW